MRIEKRNSRKKKAKNSTSKLIGKRVETKGEEENSFLHKLLTHLIELEMQNQEMREMMHRLESARDQYADLFNFAPVPYFVVNSKGIIQQANLAAGNLLGSERAKLKGKPFSIFTSEHDAWRENFYSYLIRVFKAETIQTAELLLQNKSGEFIPVQLESVRIKDDPGGLECCTMTLRDIRDEKRTKQLELLNTELFREKEISRRYLELSGVFFVALDRHGNIEMINETGKRILGIKSKLKKDVEKNKKRVNLKLEGLNWFENFIPVKDREKIKNLYNRMMLGEMEVESYENNVLCKDGSERTILWRIALLVNDKSAITGTLSSGTDITIMKLEEAKLRQTLQALKESDLGFRNIFENVNDAILIIEADSGKILNVNKKVIELLGYSFGEILQMKIFDLYPEEDLPALRERYKQLQLKGQSLFEVSPIRKDGSIIRLEVNGRLIEYDGRKAFLNVARDIGGRKKDEAFLMSALLEGQEKERKRIAADLHDSIQPLLSTIKRKVESLAPVITMNDKGIKKSYRDIDNLLDRTLKEIKAISRNLASPALADFGLVATLHDLCENMNQEQKASINFYSTGVDEKLNTKIANGLYRISQELLHNAIRHSMASAITLQLIGHSNSVVLMIEDDGKGFDVSVKRKGLGLKNITARVKAMEGNLDVDSMKERGTIITVEVPLLAG